jgi:tRNA(Ile)-lysidine synthase
LAWDTKIPLQFKHIEEILQLMSEESRDPRQIRLPAGWRAQRMRNELQLLKSVPPNQPTPSHYEYRLAVPGKVTIWEANLEIEALFVTDGSSAGYNSGIFLDPRLLEKELTVRNWRAGDRFWPAHSKTPTKIKELLQRRQLKSSERKLWPVVLSGEEVIWVKGFPPSSQLQPSPGVKEVIIIRDLPMAPGT